MLHPSPAVRRLGLALAAASAAAAIASPGSALAAWTAPTDLSAAGQSAYYPQVAFDDDGDARFAWERTDGLNMRAQTRLLHASGSLNPVVTMSPAGTDADSPVISVDSAGDALFAWTREDGPDASARVRTMSAAGVIGGAATVSGGNYGGAPRIGGQPDGDAVLTWSESDGFVARQYGRTRAADGTLGPILTLSDAGEYAWDGTVASDPAGNAVFTWSRFDGSNQRIEARTLSAAGVLGSVQTLSAAGENANEPQVALDSSGNAVFAWERYDGSNTRVQALTMSASGVLGSVRTLSNAGQPAIRPRVVLDAAGNAVFSWVRSDGTNDRVQATTMTASGSLGLVQTLSSAGQPSELAELAVNATGDAVIAWQRYDSVDYRIQARELTAAGSLNPTYTLSDAGGWAYHPMVAFHDNQAIVTWDRGDGNEIVQYAAGP